MSPLFAVMSIYWDLPILLVTFSLVYSATRHDRWDRILHEAVGWGGRVAFFLGGIAVVLFLLSSFPDYWPYILGVVAAGILFFSFGQPLWHRRRHQARTPG